MVRSAEPLVVEIHAKNNNVWFPPLSRRLRGHFSFMATGLPDALRLIPAWGDIIPGQQIHLGPETRTARLVEPLYQPDFAQARRTIENRGSQLPPAEETFANVHLGTWAFWLARLVASGLARVLRGELPRDAGPPKLERGYGVTAGSGDLVTENRDLRAQVARLREGLAELRGMMLAKNG
jgi:hypothetical protein